MIETEGPLEDDRCSTIGTMRRKNENSFHNRKSELNNKIINAL